MGFEIDIKDTIVIDDLRSTPGGIVLQIAITTVGVALGNALAWAAPKAVDYIKEWIGEKNCNTEKKG